MVPDEGFEPPTFALQERCTTTVLIRPNSPAGNTEFGAPQPVLRLAVWFGSDRDIVDQPHATNPGGSQKAGGVIQVLRRFQHRGTAQFQIIHL